MARLVTAVWSCAVVGLTAAGCEHEPDVVALFHEEAPMAGASGAAAGNAGTEAPSAAGGGGTSGMAGMAGMELPPPVSPMCPVPEFYLDAVSIVEDYDCRFEEARFPEFVAALDRFIALLPQLMGETTMLESCDFAGLKHYQDPIDKRFIIVCPTTCALIERWIEGQERKLADCLARNQGSQQGD